jgi:beta-N-acetylhexosaminidase
MTAATAAAGSLRSAALGTLMSSFPGSSPPAWLLRGVEAGLGSVALYGSNRSADIGAVAAALHGARPCCLVALDEEGGDVTRIEATTGSSLPGNAALGVVDDVDLTSAVASALGARLRSLGVDLDLAPCADVNSVADNPVIGVRSFGADPTLVARHTDAFVTGLQSAGVAACAKHFPGHGAVAVDSHVALPVVASLGQRELAPFRAAISAGVAAVMPGHLLVPSLDGAPASVSRRILVDLLRGDLGFGGVIVTDALDMGGIGGRAGIPAAVVRALAAGADLCCLGPDNDDALVAACLDAIEAAVAAGDLGEERVRSSNHHVAALTADVLSQRRQIDGDLAELGRRAARRALRVEGDLPADLGGAHLVELTRPANIAAGSVPGGATASVLRVDPAATATRVVEGDDRAVAHALVAAAGRPLIVVSRDAHRRATQAGALRTLLTARPDAVHVDEGWPGGEDPPAAARVLTHGASPACGDAVADLLLGRITCG